MTSLYDGLSEDTPWFDTLQANILKPHGRDHVRLLLVSFDAVEDARRIRSVLGSIPVTSLRDQLGMVEAFRKGESTAPVTSVWLTATGYRALGIAEEDLPSDPSFRSGMQEVGSTLNDPPADTWEPPYQRRLDAVVAVAGDDERELASVSDGIVEALREATGVDAVVAVEAGSISRSDDRAEEHFGFADGISNPLFLRGDIERQSSTELFDGRASKELALIVDPGAPDAYGSYVVLRKLRQFPERFAAVEKELAEELGLGGADKERAGAMMLGRFRDGTPLSLAGAAGAGRVNDFDYGGDPDGARCPVHAHVRKMNDRLQNLKKPGTWHEESRRRRIVRRGFLYGDLNGTDEADEVGLMFVSFQASIRDQFEHLQRRFANDPDYFGPRTGLDPIAGQGPGTQAQAWPARYKDDTSLTRADVGRTVELRGGAYLFAPSVSFLSSLVDAPTDHPASLRKGSTARVARLREVAVDRAFANRADEWLTPAMFADVLGDPAMAAEPVIVRKAHANRVMLEAMTDPGNSETTRTFEIDDGELIVGRIPLGSVGLGKVYPEYLTPDERRVASVCNRDESSVFGHTVPNFSRVLEEGLLHYANDARARSEDVTYRQAQRDFFCSVAVSCEAVIAYAGRFAELADSLAETNPDRKDELAEIARVCRQVPARPAETFHEAVQCVWFVHLAQSSFCALNSLGRLDQTLMPYFERDDDITREKALELVECFLIKCAERLHLDPSTLRDADHLSFGTGIGTRPIYLDQVASSNNFIQNIVIGGVDKDGEDATNDVTYLFLEASGSVALCTPTLNVRLHDDSPAELLGAIDRSFRRARTGLPILYNDGSIIGGLEASGVPTEVARDYSCAGCWEPVLSGRCSFIFGMVNMPTTLEAALNEGMRLTSGTMFLRGQKWGPRGPRASEFESFDDLLAEFRKQIGFFADKVALQSAAFFLLPGEVTPTPFMSLLIDGCYERGLDQSRGGAEFNLVGNLAFGVPNAINALANIQRYVFEEERWKLDVVVEAMRRNWGVAPVRSEYDEDEGLDKARIDEMQRIRRTFLDSPKWGNGDARVEAIAEWLVDNWYDACEQAAALCRRTFLAGSEDSEARKLRGMANYQGPSLTTAGEDRLGSEFKLVFTHGSGTFGQYSSMGLGVAASADGRGQNEPLAPNLSPPGGTAKHGLHTFFDSLNRLGLDRFGCAAVTDIRVDGTDQPSGFFADLATDWARAGGSMMTVSCLSTMEMEVMYRLSQLVRAGAEPSSALRPYADNMCRVGGWNSAFICLPLGQQRDHLLRAQW